MRKTDQTAAPPTSGPHPPAELKACAAQCIVTLGGHGVALQAAWVSITIDRETTVKSKVDDLV